ncbi:hypothetical protein niasHT_007098 [Heterodera trifolii]|uniref:Uncharacterized protein n=1 Tax=Heterodera trifolii TaxID=157864 RepID=A0ABD2LXJ3_9BILA
MLRGEYSAESDGRRDGEGMPAGVGKTQAKDDEAQRQRRGANFGGNPPIGGENIRREGFEMFDFDGVASNAKSARRFGRLIRRRFLLLVLCSACVAFILLAILIIFVLLRSMQKFEEGTESEAMGKTQSERFMLLYERIMRFRTNVVLTADSMISKMPADELARAEAAGILPIGSEPNEGFSSKINGTDGSFGRKGKGSTENLTNSHGFYRHEWHDAKCVMKCEKNDVSIPPLLVISLDGFLREYLSRNIVQTLHRMGECGAQADFLFPSFPSRTFPNHHTIATGLWPGVHGVVDNVVFDAQISAELEQMSNVKNAAFYGGEPIWSLAVRQHKRVFCLFWPGCSFNITGYNPTLDLPYNSSFPYSKRVDKIVEWLSLPAIDRPSLIMAYFDQPDNVGHYHTSEKQMELELVYLESVLDYLFNSLHGEGILDCVNLIILSDHGMQRLNKRFYFNELIGPTKSSGVIATSGVIGHIYLPNGTNSDDFKDQLVNKLACYENTKFHLFDRKQLPKRYHYGRLRRVGDLVFDGRPGVSFDVSPSESFNLTSDHGYDYRFEQMHAIFFARGPNIRKGVRIEPFQNVELFNLFIDLLRLPQNVPNNGTLGLLDPLILNMDLHRPPFFPFDPDSHPLGECAADQSNPRQFTQCEGGKTETTECEQKIRDAQRKMDECRKSQMHPLNAIFYTKLANLCVINLCPALLLMPNSDEKEGPTVLYESLSAADFSEFSGGASSSQCPFFDKSIGKKCQNRTKNASNGTVWKSIAASRNNVYSSPSDFVPLLFPMFDFFADGPFIYLQNLTENYVRLFGRVVSLTGTIIDEDFDGIGDQRQKQRNKNKSVGNSSKMPTHFFRILFRCEDNLWHLNGINCKWTNATRVLAFVLPNVQRDLNCLGADEYLLVNTARVRDIELLTGIEFFAERMWYPTEDQLQWRTNISTELWH